MENISFKKCSQPLLLKWKALFSVGVVKGCHPSFGLMNPNPLSYLANHRGMALILCLLVTSTLVLIGTIAYNICWLNQKIVCNYATGSKAFYVAEAGREHALAYLRSNLLWRGEITGATGIYEGGLGEENSLGTFSVTVADGTDDQNGIFDPLIPGCFVRLSVTGVYRNSMQELTCLVKFIPNPMTLADVPFKAVVTSGRITGAGILGLNDWGVDNSHMITSEVSLPPINLTALKALADIALPNLDKKEFDASLSSRDSFWKDDAATQPYIIFIQGDLILSDTQHLYGIILVEGSKVLISGDARVNGILYAPHADLFSFQCASAAPQPVVTGQIVAGLSGIAITGSAVTIQLDRNYVTAFNIVGGADVDVGMQSGSWASISSTYD